MEERFELNVARWANFPRPGVNFVDMGAIFEDPDQWSFVVAALSKKAIEFRPDHLLAVESRGFVLAGAIATVLQIGFSLARKAPVPPGKGKLPGKVIKGAYQTEYSEDHLELQPQRLRGERVLIVDDVLATGGTIECCAAMIRASNREPVGGIVVFDVAACRKGRQMSIPVTYLEDV